MNASLSPETVDEISARVGRIFPRENASAAGRQPVHTVYGGAHLFRSGTTQKLGSLALRSMNEFAAEPAEFPRIFGMSESESETVFCRVRTKLEQEPVEDYRIDFEDGYGTRSDAEEDQHAKEAAADTAAALIADILPVSFGIRIKPLIPASHRRAIRTLDIFLSNLLETTTDRLPANFVVTLPKIEEGEQVASLADLLDEIELKLGLESGSIKIELMIETARSIISRDGRVALPGLVEAARGRCSSVHFGAFDYTADLGITAAYQDLRHPACDYARHVMQTSLAGMGIRLSDGVTTVMPVGPNRGADLSPDQIEQNRSSVRNAWRIHYDNCRYALSNGFYQGWDLHPAQLVARYAAVYSFFIEGLDTASTRLKNFIDKAAQATLTGNDFDDAATGQGFLNYFVRAVNCGALSEKEVFERTGIAAQNLRSGSFENIIRAQT